MKYLVTFNGLYWTGNRFSEHIAEALEMSHRKALRCQSSLAIRLDIQPSIMESPELNDNSSYD